MSDRADYPSISEVTPTDLAGREHWDRIWDSGDTGTLPPRRKPGRVHREISDYIVRACEQRFSSPVALLELGCGGSSWLPEFAERPEFEVSGIDYSEVGCSRARALLAQARQDGQIIRSDIFDPPPEFEHSFDVVVSFGVLEHFGDTAATVRAFRRYLRPGGVMITSVPNMGGWVGQLTAWLNPAVYEMHTVLSPGDLARAHAAAGLEVLDTRYIAFTNFGVPNVQGLPPKAPSTIAKRALLRGLTYISTATWWLEDHFTLKLRPNRRLSPSVICSAIEGAE